jgi:hypothetical protein
MTAAEFSFYLTRRSLAWLYRAIGCLIGGALAPGSLRFAEICRWFAQSVDGSVVERHQIGKPECVSE